MSAPVDAIASRFDFERGPLAGTTLALHEHVLVHRGPGMLETVPLAAIAALRIAYRRDEARICWAVALLVLALGLWALAGPLAGYASSAAGEIVTQAKNESAGGGQGVASALLATFRGLEAAARLLPVVASALAAAGIALGVLGWWGTTTLTLTLAAVERDYSVRGRNGMLYDFAEALSDRLLARGR